MNTKLKAFSPGATGEVEQASQRRPTTPKTGVGLAGCKCENRDDSGRPYFFCYDGSRQRHRKMLAERRVALL